MAKSLLQRALLFTTLLGCASIAMGDEVLTPQPNNYPQSTNTNAVAFGVQAGAIAGTAQACGLDVSTFTKRVGEAIDKLSANNPDKLVAITMFQRSMQQAQANEQSDHTIPCSQVTTDFNSLPLLRPDYEATVISQLNPAMLNSNSNKNSQPPVAPSNYNPSNYNPTVPQAGTSGNPSSAAVIGGQPTTTVAPTAPAQYPPATQQQLQPNVQQQTNGSMVPPPSQSNPTPTPSNPMGSPTQPFNNPAPTTNFAPSPPPTVPSAPMQNQALRPDRSMGTSVQPGIPPDPNSVMPNPPQGMNNPPQYNNTLPAANMPP